MALKSRAIGPFILFPSAKKAMVLRSISGILRVSLIVGGRGFRMLIAVKATARNKGLVILVVTVAGGGMSTAEAFQLHRVISMRCD